MIVPEAKYAYLEEFADEFLRFYKRGFAETGTWFGILSPDQLQMRQEREVVVDPASFAFGRPGLYRRTYNPLFGKRPRKYQPGDNALEFDARLPGDPPTPLGWTGDQWARSAAFADAPRQGEFWHLSSGQRCRIRKIMGQVSNRADAREAVKVLLAEHYGVPPWIVSRCCVIVS